MMDQENKLNTREALPLLPGVSRGKLDAPPPPRRSPYRERRLPARRSRPRGRARRRRGT